MIFLVFLLWFAAELVAFVEVAQAIGVVLALVLLLATSFVGSALLRREGLRAWLRIRETVAAGRSPASEITSGSLALAGAGLLLAPGFISDAVGILLLLPGTRHAINALIRWRARKRLGAQSGERAPRGRRRSTANRVIEGEAVEKRPPSVNDTPPTSNPQD